MARIDLRRWPRHESGPKRGRLLSVAELKARGLKPVYLADKPTKAKAAKPKAKAAKAAKPKPKATKARDDREFNSILGALTRLWNSEG